ncbi:MAG TPA: hypothetical protein VLB27_09085 [candidate division Zixibacteria bacterium]|nr:hypothetical protein [candidate division Zixibacteria bacterium]
MNGQPLAVYIYPRIDAQTTIDPTPSVGHDLMIAGGFGFITHLTRTFSEFQNFKEDAPLDVLLPNKAG